MDRRSVFLFLIAITSEQKERTKAMNQNRKRKIGNVFGAGHRACALALSTALLWPAGSFPVYGDAGQAAGENLVFAGIKKQQAEMPFIYADEISAGADGGIALRSVGGPEQFEPGESADSHFQYSGINFSHVDEQGAIHMHAELQPFAYTVSAYERKPEETDPYAGKFLLEFAEMPFYTEIERITIRREDGGSAEMQTAAKQDGALWVAEVNEAFELEAEQTERRHYDIELRLRDGKMLSDLGLSDRKLLFTSYFILGNGARDKGGYRNGFIWQNNPAAETEHTTGNGVLAEPLSHHVKLKWTNEKVIFSYHSIKTERRLETADPAWVLNIEERIAPELLPYIEKAEVYAAYADGGWAGNRKFEVPLTDDGSFSTAKAAELSIQEPYGENTAEHRETVQKNLAEIFTKRGGYVYYMVAYRLKADTSIRQILDAVRDYQERSGEQIMFESWLAADYLDQGNATDQPDGGAESKLLAGSYTTDFFELADTDGDGLFDPEEAELKTNPKKADSDGDGVPDWQEYKEDKTDPADAGNYQVQKPEGELKRSDSGAGMMIEGRVPWKFYPDPQHSGQKLKPTDQKAGGVTVKLQAYDKTVQAAGDKIYQEMVIPYEMLLDGTFRMELPEGSIPDGTDMVLSAYSPDGKISALGSVFTYRAEPEKKQADLYRPNAEREIVTEGDAAGAYDLTDNIKNMKELPEGTKVTDITPDGAVDLKTPGNYQGTVLVTYPDSSSETVTVKVKVKAKKPDAKMYDPEIVPEYLYPGERADLTDNVVNIGDELPLQTEVEDISSYGEGKGEVNVDKPGKYKGRILLTYPDGSTKELSVPVWVLRDGGDGKPGTPSEASPSLPTPSEPEENDAHLYEPKPAPIVIDKGGHIDPADGIANKAELPAGTEYIDATPKYVDMEKDYTATILVRYPDGTVDLVKVPVTVKQTEKPEDGKGDSGKNDNPGGDHGGSHGGGSSSGGSSLGGRVVSVGASNDKVYADPDAGVTRGSVGGTWNLIDAEANRWTYTTAGGVLAKDGWLFIENPYAKDKEGRFSWFKFNAEGIMQFGWIRSQNGNWYHTHAVSDGNLGMLEKGWYHETMDSRWYYLDEMDGKMHDGWTKVGGREYYLTPVGEVPQQTYFQKEDGYWYYQAEDQRPYGSMYQNEETPDGYRVGEDGAWIR